MALRVVPAVTGLQEMEAAVTDNLPEAVVTDNLPEAAVTDNLPEAAVTDNLPAIPPQAHHPGATVPPEHRMAHPINRPAAALVRRGIRRTPISKRELRPGSSFRR